MAKRSIVTTTEDTDSALDYVVPRKRRVVVVRYPASIPEKLRPEVRRAARPAKKLRMWERPELVELAAKVIDASGSHVGLTPTELLRAAARRKQDGATLREKLSSIVQSMSTALRSMFTVDRDALPGLVTCLLELSAEDLFRAHHDSDRTEEKVNMVVEALHTWYLEKSKLLDELFLGFLPPAMQGWKDYWVSKGVADHPLARVYLYLTLEDAMFWELGQAPSVQDDEDAHEYDGMPQFGIFDDFQRTTNSSKVRDRNAWRDFHRVEAAHDAGLATDAELSEALGRKEDAEVEARRRNRLRASDQGYRRIAASGARNAEDKASNFFRYSNRARDERGL